MNPKIKPILDELREALVAHYGERLAKLVLFVSLKEYDARQEPVIINAQRDGSEVWP